MRSRWGAAFLLVGALWTVTAEPSEAAVPPPVRLDAACAAGLVARLGPVGVLGCDPAGRGLAVGVLGSTEVRAVDWRARAGTTPVTAPFPGLPAQ